MLFVDLFNFKTDDQIKRHIVKILLDDESYSKLKNPTLNLEYLLIKNFNQENVKKALNDYHMKKFLIPTNTRNQVTALFDKNEYDKFYTIVKENDDFSTINYCAKILFYWLVNNNNSKMEE